jgi:hypothetical protein
MTVRLSALGAVHSPPRIFLVLISARDRVDPRVIVRQEELRQLKKRNDIGSRTLNIPVFNIVPQPNMLPRAPKIGMQGK